MLHPQTAPAILRLVAFETEILLNFSALSAIMRLLEGA